MIPLRLAILITAASCSACNTAATISVNGVTVKSSGRMGGMGTLYVRDGRTEVAISDDNRDSFREVAKTARFGIGAAQLASVAKSGIGAVTSVKNTATTAKAGTAAAQETTKQAAIAAEAEAARLAAEEAAAASDDLVLPPIP